MRISRLLFLLSTLALLSIPASAQLNDTYVIPVSGNLSGGFGTRWMTQFSVMNPHLDYPLRVSVTLLPTGGGAGIEELIDIPANSVAWSDNLLWDLYGIEGGGTLLVATFAEDNPGVPNDVLSRAFLVNSNTYNNAPTGTYGQTIPGTWTGLMDVDTDGITAIAHGINNRRSEGWRTNVGAANLGRCNVNLLVSVFDADGNRILNNAPFVLPPMGHFQQALPVEVDNGSIEFVLDDPCANNADDYAVVFPYTSTIDQYSGDPRYQSPQLLALAGNLYAKGGSVDPTTFGKKIDSSYAARVRATAQHRGTARLQKSAKGWQIVR